MKTTGSGKAGVQRGIKDARRLPQAEFGVFGGEALEEILGSHAGPTVKEAMEMGLTEYSGGGEFAEVRLGGMVFIQVMDDIRNTIKIIHTATLIEGPDLPTRFLR